MTRSRASARAAGARFERSIADWLAEHLDDRIDRRVKTGTKDRGDIGGIRHRGERVVLEIKDTARTDLACWLREAHLEARNEDARIGVVVAKRRGTTNPADQWVHMTLADLAWLLGADHPTYDE